MRTPLRRELSAVPLVALACAMFAAGCMLAAAAEGELLEWSKDRRLARADFKGTSALPRGIGALSFIAIKAGWTCDGDRFEPRIQAVFDPSRSTWGGRMRSGFDASDARPMTVSTGQVLQHEQTHFDIAELAARKIRRHLSGLTDVCTRAGGMTSIAAVVEDYQRELDEEQARYDRQTIYGIDLRMQWTWTARTLKALEDRERK